MNPSLHVIMRLFLVWMVDRETWQSVLKNLAVFAQTWTCVTSAKRTRVVRTQCQVSRSTIHTGKSPMITSRLGFICYTKGRTWRTSRRLSGKMSLVRCFGTSREEFPRRKIPPRSAPPGGFLTRLASLSYRRNDQASWSTHTILGEGLLTLGAPVQILSAFRVRALV